MPSEGVPRMTDKDGTGDDCIADATRQLAGWVIKRTAGCALFFFTAVVIETQSPFPFGSDYRQAAIYTAVATPVAGLILAGRAWLFLQGLLAERAGITFSRWLGHRFRGILVPKTSR